jgi:sensor histidine kinase regulating citrate/malate metabolism
MADDLCEEMERLLRLQRHEFINHMQVIHTLIQLGRTEKAIRYIEDLAHNQDLLAESRSLHQQQPSCQRHAR